MYLPHTLTRNRRLIEAAVKHHQNGSIPPATFVIDTDTVTANTQRIATAATKAGLDDLFYMSKQIGHNAETLDAIETGGITHTVAVDARSAAHLANTGRKLGNIGHLSQIPRAQLAQLLTAQPRLITVFNTEQAHAVATAARQLGTTQDIQLRVRPDGAPEFQGQYGGFTPDEVRCALTDLVTTRGVNVVGVAAYPCVSFSDTDRTFAPTRSLDALIEAAKYVADGIDHAPIVNAPGATSVDTVALIADAGGTVGEPGHALTGTGPHHAYGLGDEQPAIVYVSEVTQVDEDAIHAFGGGLYRRGRMNTAIIANNPDYIDPTPLPVDIPDAEFIDYYFSITPPQRPIAVGDTVIAALRPQVFVTYCRTIAITGLSQGTGTLGRLHDSIGNLDTTWPTS